MEHEVHLRKPYPTDVSDEEWAFVAPYLTLMNEDAPQRRYDLREVFNTVRWIVRAGAPWRRLPTNFPPWEAVYQQTQRWIKAGCFEAMVHDLRALLRWSVGRADQPTAVVIDSATRQSTPESGHRAGYDGHKKRTGSKIHAAVDTLGELLVLHVTPANASDRAQVAALAEEVQTVTGQTVELGFVDQGYSRVKFLGHAIQRAMLRFYTGETGASRSKWYCRVPNDKCSWIWRADGARTADARRRLPSQLESNQAPRMVIRGRTATRVSVSRRAGSTV
jgi:transposase